MASLFGNPQQPARPAMAPDPLRIGQSFSTSLKSLESRGMSRLKKALTLNPKTLKATKSAPLVPPEPWRAPAKPHWNHGQPNKVCSEVTAQGLPRLYFWELHRCFSKGVRQPLQGLRLNNHTASETCGVDFAPLGHQPEGSAQGASLCPFIDRLASRGCSFKSSPATFSCRCGNESR